MTRIALTAREAAEALRGTGELPGDAEEVLERWALVVWNTLTEPGDGDAGRLVGAWGAREALRRAVLSAEPDAGGLLDPQGLDQARKRWLPRLDADAVLLSLQRAVRTGARLITRHDAEWPVQVDDLDVHAPLALWVQGDASALTRLRPSIALVGARAASSYGEHVAFELASELAGAGVPVVSGAAYGIDGAAHRAALAADALTVALLAGGVDRPYPAGHHDLIGRIARSGAVVSEVPCGTSPTKWRFLARNRLIAALSSATVVVEAGWRSGAINTAAHAASLGRGVGAVPGPVTSPSSAGCHRLLRDYTAQCITSAADVRELIGLGPARAVPDDPSRTDELTRIRDALSLRSWREAGDVARRAGMATDAVTAALGLLRLHGEVESDLLGGWRLTGPSGRAS